MSKFIDLTGKRFGILTVLSRCGTSKNGDAIWLCLCGCGNETSKTSRSLTKRGVSSCGCLIAKERQKQRECRQQEIIGTRFGSLTAINVEPDKGRRHYYLCRCDCGNETKVREDALLSGKVQSCGCMRVAIINEKREKRREDLTGQKFGRWTVLEKYGYHRHLIHWTCRCDCGTVRFVSEAGLRNGTSSSCGCYNREVVSSMGELKIKNLTGQRFGRLVAIYRTNKQAGNNYKWHCLCDCGRGKDVAGYELTSGKTKSCGCCDFVSHGEWKIRQLLDSAGIAYEHEKTFAGCVNPKTNARYRFDFYVNNEYIIEFDGTQHFYKIGSSIENKRPLATRREADMNKNRWCLEHDIPIIRIPYYRIDDLSLEDLKPDTAEFIIQGYISGWAYLLPE